MFNFWEIEQMMQIDVKQDAINFTVAIIKRGGAGGGKDSYQLTLLPKIGKSHSLHLFINKN